MFSLHECNIMLKKSTQKGVQIVNSLKPNLDYNMMGLFLQSATLAVELTLKIVFTDGH